MQEMEQKRQSIIQRFVAACQKDERLLAAFLGGSYGNSTPDAYSDLDFGLVTTDEAYDDFLASREAFIRSLGEPIFLEVFSDYGFDIVFFTFADGVECELVIGRASQFTHIHVGPYRILLDKKHLLDHISFPRDEIDQVEQIEKLRGSISWFWHDLGHHFITPLARGRLWSAYGGLQDLRLSCVNLALLNEDFSASPDGYEKVELVLAPAQLAPLEASCCTLERGAMLQAAHTIIAFYQTLAIPLARMYSIPYPTDLDRIMCDRLEQLQATR